MGKLVNYIILAFIFSIGLFSSDHLLAQKSRRKDIDKEAEVSAKNREAEYYFTEGEKYFILEDYAKAFVLFQKAKELAPQEAAIYFKISQIQSKGDELDKALENILTALAIEKNNKYYYLLAADLYTRLSDFERAVGIYEEMIGQIPNTNNYLFELAALYLFKNDLEGAINTYNRAEEIYGVNEKTTFQKQKILLKQNKVDEAIEEGRRLISSNPDESQYILSLAEIQISNLKYEDGVTTINQALKSDPQNSRARLLLANAYEKLNRIKEAEAQLMIAFEDPGLDPNIKLQVLNGYLTRLSEPEVTEFVLELGNKIINAHPSFSPGFASLGNIYQQINKKKEALALYLTSLHIDNSNFGVWQNVMAIQLDLNKNDDLITNSEKAIELFPNQSVFFYYNGVANYQEKNYKDAANAFEQGKKLSRSDKQLVITFNSLLGDSYNYTKEFDKSDVAYEAVLADDPDNDVVLNNYAYFLSLRKEKLDLAKKMSSRLTKRNPANATYLDTHAWVLFISGEYKSAKETIEKALHSDSANATHLEHYGDILYKLGDINGAVEQWQKAKGLNSASELIDKKIADRKLYEE